MLIKFIERTSSSRCTTEKTTPSKDRDWVDKFQDWRSRHKVLIVDEHISYHWKNNTSELKYWTDISWDWRSQKKNGRRLLLEKNTIDEVTPGGPRFWWSCHYMPSKKQHIGNTKTDLTNLEIDKVTTEVSLLTSMSPTAERTTLRKTEIEPTDLEIDEVITTSYRWVHRLPLRSNTVGEVTISGSRYQWSCRLPLKEQHC